MKEEEMKGEEATSVRDEERYHDGEDFEVYSMARAVGKNGGEGAVRDEGGVLVEKKDILKQPR